jgi:hypothetical protein
MVMTAPLDGLSGVVNRVVVVLDNAHAAGPVTNARALNSTGIHLLGDTCLEVIRRLNATIGFCVMGFIAPIRTVIRKRQSVGNKRLT